MKDFIIYTIKLLGVSIVFVILGYILGYTTFYLICKKGQSISYVPHEVRQLLADGFNQGKIRTIESGIFDYKYGISLNPFKREIYKNDQLVLGRKDSGGISYVSPKIILIISGLPSMFESFWSYMFVPPYTKIDIRNMNDFSLLYSLYLWKGGTGYIPYKDKIYYVCGSGYANAHNQDMMTLPASDICEIDIGESFE